MRKVLILALALILLLGIMSHGTFGHFSDTEGGSTTLCAWTADNCDPCGNHYITLVANTGTTWDYEVTSGSSPALSHWVIEWCDYSAVVAVYENGVLLEEGVDWEYGTDPHTGITGIKFDNDYDDWETRTITILLDDVYTEGLITIGVKSGQEITFCEVWGPLCDDCAGHSDPVVTDVFPNHYISYSVGDTIPISWYVTDVDGDFPLTIDIDFSPDDGANYGYHIATIQQNGSGYNSYLWTIPWVQYLISNDCRIRVTATDACGSGVGISALFCPHLPPPPEVIVISPNGGESWQAGQSYPITWATLGDFPEMMSIDVYLSFNNGVSWIQILSDEENDGICLWQVPAAMPTSEPVIIRIIAKYPINLSGQDDSNQAFTILGLEPPPPEADLAEAYRLAVNNSQVTLTAEMETLADVALANSGEADIAIDRLLISWNPDSGDSRIVEIWPAGGPEYFAAITSGSVWDIPDFILTPGEEGNISFIFGNGELGETVTIEFIMSDGSIVMVSFYVITA